MKSYEKNYGEYVSRQDHNKTNNYILQDEYKYNKWDYVKIDLVKILVNTEYLRTKQKVKTIQDSRVDEDV